METAKRRFLHWAGWMLIDFTYWMENNIRTPFLSWNLKLHDLMEKNHLCCDRHGYSADPKYCDPKVTK